MQERSALATPIMIEDSKDFQSHPLLDAYRDIRERDLVGRQGRFVAEGEVVLRLMLKRSRFALESVLLSQKRAASSPDLVASIPDAIPLFVAPDDVIENLAGFPLHRGVLAIGRKNDPLPASEVIKNLPQQALVVICVGIANHDNIGGIFRNAAAFGATAIFLDETCCDPLYRKAIRVSVGASLVVPFVQGGNAIALIRDLKAVGFETLALTPQGTTRLCDLQPSIRTALVLGAEGPGLPGEIIAGMRSVSIPMANDFDSLNVATTSGIALHHLRKRDEE